MKGTLLDFSIQYNEGIINGEDNKRYSFIGAEWKEQVAPVRGQQVDFLVNELGQAVGVYLATLGTPFQQPAAFQESNAQLQEEQNYGFFDWAMKCLKNYTNFSGRARRKEYWYFYLFQILSGFILALILAIIGLSEGQVNIFTGLLNLFFFLPALAVGVRRLHDVHRSGWWMLIAFTIIGLIPLFIWMVSETRPERNQWGSPAK
ncbi:DUF805 domain-containing protein [Acinetobacter sp. ANC 4641]|uniref:DUF805 domain-containing protein n=1 Tax=Acinetobacter sp. ANC 4641 TaxID=2529847 RepID=UPI0010408D7D|nr:DUF805 domain-containing protein [Acinetobacter sp. ANC 4641]TCB07458.1 DUF805 domain-containing protein [Acinetobacter sp. ANC 4641]